MRVGDTLSDDGVPAVAAPAFASIIFGLSVTVDHLGAVEDAATRAVVEVVAGGAVALGGISSAEAVCAGDVRAVTLTDVSIGGIEDESRVAVAGAGVEVSTVGVGSTIAVKGDGNTGYLVVVKSVTDIALAREGLVITAVGVGGHSRVAVAVTDLRGLVPYVAGVAIAGSIVIGGVYAAICVGEVGVVVANENSTSSIEEYLPCRAYAARGVARVRCSVGAVGS